MSSLDQLERTLLLGHLPHRVPAHVLVTRDDPSSDTRIPTKGHPYTRKVTIFLLKKCRSLVRFCPHRVSVTRGDPQSDIPTPKNWHLTHFFLGPSPIHASLSRGSLTRHDPENDPHTTTKNPLLVHGMSTHISVTRHHPKSDTFPTLTPGPHTPSLKNTLSDWARYEQTRCRPFRL